MWQNPLLMLATKWTKRRKVALPIPTYTKADVLLLKELVESGAFHAVIDRCYPMKDVIEAYRYVEKGQKIGNVVLDIA